MSGADPPPSSTHRSGPRLLATAALLTLLASSSACATTAHAGPGDAPAVTDALTLLDPWFDAVAARARLPGVVAVVVRGEEPLWSAAAGYADRARTRPLTATSPVFAGSVTKVLTAVVALRLHAGGDLDLDAPIGRAVPELAERPAGAATLRAALAHRAGLPREGATPYWMTYRFPTRDALLAELAALPPPEGPTTTAYSNVGPALVGEAVARATGRPFAAALDEHLLAPLGLAATTARADDARRAGLAAAWSPPRLALVGERAPREHGDPAAFTPAFGVITTAADLARLASSLLGAPPAGSIALEPDVIAATFAPVDVEGPWSEARSVAFELTRRGDHVWAAHNGWFGGHRAQLTVVPSLNLAAIVIGTADDAPVEEIAERILLHLRDAEAVARAVGEAGAEGASDRGAARAEALDLARLAGRYANPWLPERDVVLLHDGLWQYTPPGGTRVPVRHGLDRLVPVDVDRFRVGHEDGPVVVFERDSDGRGARLVTQGGAVWFDRTF